MKTAVTTLAFCVIALLTLGMVMLYSSSMTQFGSHYLIMQLIWCALGLGVCVTATCVDYRLLKKFAVPLYVIAVIALALVLEPNLGLKVKGARRWFDFGFMRFQPSEVGKIALIIALAWYADRYQRYMNTWSRGILPTGAIVVVILGLIFVEPDRGTTILLAAVSGTMLLIAGVRWKHLVTLAIPGVLAIGYLIWRDPVRMARVMSWMDVEGSKTGVGFQAHQGMLALGSGGWTGLGLGNGRQKLGWVPEHHTDFIFAIIGEELGLIATLLVVVAYVMIVICGIYISLRAPDAFGFLLGCGLTFLIGLQAFINIGVVTGALPNKGLALPFISYGGSNLLAMFSCVGLIFSIARKGRELPAIRKNPFAAGEIPEPA